MPRKRQAKDEVDKVVERLREFIRFGYVTGSEAARQLGVRDSTVYSWLQGEFKPAHPPRIRSFLDSLPVESGSGISPTGYKYREYKNWRGIPKPRRCPFCKRAKGRIRSEAAIKACVSAVESKPASKGRIKTSHFSV
jgi:hypothetical protein